MGIGASSSSGGAHAPPMRTAYTVNRDARLRWGGLPAPACDLSSVRRAACHLIDTAVSGHPVRPADPEHDVGQIVRRAGRCRHALTSQLALGPGDVSAPSMDLT